MSSSVLLLLLLAIPGLAARAGRNWVMRVRQRSQRDLLSVISLLVPLSLLFIAIAHLLLHCTDLRVAPADYDALIGSSPETGPPSLTRFLPLLALSTVLGFLFGAVFGKVELWRLGPNKLGAHPLDALMGGTTLPVVGAAVLTTTQINNKLIVYYGRLHGIQIGPEGKVDFVVISGKITKSLLSDGKHKFAGGTEQDGYPVTRKPFLIVADSGAKADGQRVKTDRLLIESEDIANIHLELYDDILNGDWLDQCAYYIGRKTGWIRAIRPEPPPVEAKSEA
ncbi:hypothetical protein [Hyphomonas sp.]|uniref:hypothetical protein n=1 Tax=Hyphomonas sp. TaxID=87 RepID=UPI0025BD0BBC|nr:hypothetical protein [Hyphomonas sp.]